MFDFRFTQINFSGITVEEHDSVTTKKKEKSFPQKEENSFSENHKMLLHIFPHWLINISFQECQVTY